jgi:hypothetical protein
MLLSTALQAGTEACYNSCGFGIPGTHPLTGFPVYDATDAGWACYNSP